MAGELEDRVRAMELSHQQQKILNMKMISRIDDLQYTVGLLLRLVPDAAEQYRSRIGRLNVDDGVGTGPVGAEQDWVWIDSGVSALGPRALAKSKLSEVLFSIADTVQRIGDYAFTECLALRSISIPASVTTIAEGAFFKSPLEVVVFAPDAVLESVGKAAFWETQLEAVDLPPSLVTVGEVAFGDCARLARVSFGAESRLRVLGPGAFVSCGALRAMELPGSLRAISALCFLNCPSMEAVTFGNSLVKIGAGAFNGCAVLRQVTLPPSVSTIGCRAREIALCRDEKGRFDGGVFVSATTRLGAFQNCFALEEITFGDDDSGLVELGERTFSGCVRLREVGATPRLAFVGSGSFTGCTALRDVPPLSSVALEQIGEEALSGCSAVTELRFEAALVAVGARCFEGCASLRNIVFGGDRFALLGNEAFKGCAALRSLTLRIGPQQWGRDCWPPNCEVKFEQ